MFLEYSICFILVYGAASSMTQRNSSSSKAGTYTDLISSYNTLISYKDLRTKSASSNGSYNDLLSRYASSNGSYKDLISRFASSSRSKSLSSRKGSSGK